MCGHNTTTALYNECTLEQVETALYAYNGSIETMYGFNPEVCQSKTCPCNGYSLLNNLPEVFRPMWH